MDEFSLINKIKQSYYRQASLIKGVGDDGAVFRETAEDIVTVTDMFVEGVHFTRQTMTPKQIGYKALAGNLSDLAAMGAKPMFYLVSIVVPSSWQEDVIALYKGMESIAKTFQIDLIGGDTVSGEQLTVSITMIGRVLSERVRYRSLAKPGDILFVTGTLGDSQAGLFLLQSKQTFRNEQYFIKRHQYPFPRVSFSLALEEIDRIAFNDISDGLMSEAKEIAIASGVNLVIDDSLIPIDPNYYQFNLKQQEEWKLFGGEDFELLGATSPRNWERIKMIAKNTNTPVTKIGYVESLNHKDEDGEVFLIVKGKKKIVNRRGYTHLT